MPLLFCVGGTQASVTFELFSLTIGLVVVVVFVLPALLVTPGLTVAPVLLEELALLVACEPVVFCVAAASPAEPDPESSPQPASATPKLPNSAMQATRPDPNPRSAFLMRPPNVTPMPAGPDEVIHQEVASA